MAAVVVLLRMIFRRWDGKLKEDRIELTELLGSGGVETL